MDMGYCPARESRRHIQDGGGERDRHLGVRLELTAEGVIGVQDMTGGNN